MRNGFIALALTLLPAAIAAGGEDLAAQNAALREEVRMLRAELKMLQAQMEDFRGGDKASSRPATQGAATTAASRPATVKPNPAYTRMARRQRLLAAAKVQKELALAEQLYQNATRERVGPRYELATAAQKNAKVAQRREERDASRGKLATLRDPKTPFVPMLWGPLAVGSAGILPESNSRVGMVLDKGSAVITFSLSTGAGPSEAAVIVLRGIDTKGMKPGHPWKFQGPVVLTGTTQYRGRTLFAAAPADVATGRPRKVGQ